MTTITPESTIGQIVTSEPGTARVLERLNLDYCCGGRKSLKAACEARGLRTQDVIRDLETAGAVAGDRRWDGATISQLADHIEQAHHRPLRAELSRLAVIIEKVCTAHGEREPSLLEVSRVFTALAEELREHMDEEERTLFPAARALERGGPEAPPDAQFIAHLVHDHSDVGRSLGVLRALTDGYTAPGGACNTYRVMLHSLRELELDLHSHIHKENNILFPSVLRAAGQR